MSFDRNIKIGSLMTTDIITVKPNDNLLKVEEIFIANTFHHIPVVDKQGIIQGIISRVEFYKLQHALTIFNTKGARKHNDSIFNATLVEEVMSKQVAKLGAEDSVLVAVPGQTDNHTEVLAELYGKIKKGQPQKMDILKASRLYDKKNEVTFENYEDRFNKMIRKHVKRDSYFKIKSGWGSQVRKGFAKAS